MCNHCDSPPCIKECEESALQKNPDGVVVLSKEVCTNCQKCFDACPYNAIETGRYSGKPEKCDFCHSRIQRGELPACVMSCMGKAFLFGDIKDKESEISIALKDSRIKVLDAGIDTHPSVFYIFNDDCGTVPLKDYDINQRPPVSIAVSGKHIDNLSKDGSKVSQIYTSDAMCPSECGISVHVENGIAKKIYGNPHSLVNNGTLCAKGAAGLQMTYSPHRVKTPLIRTGERGEDKWEEISWKEASDHIAKKLTGIKKRYGAEAVFLDVGDVTDREAYYRLFHAFGTPNTFNHGSICDPNRKWGQAMMLGDERPLPDIQRPLLIRGKNNTTYHKTGHDARLILNVGTNPFVATRFNYMSSGIPSARQENNCIYIVVDPACTNSAALADIWLPIIPGTDAALLAAMLFYIINNDSKNSRYLTHDFIEKYTTGWQEFKEAFLSHAERKDPSCGLRYFTPEWAAEKTGISKNEIEKISHLFGITKPATIEIGMHGTAHHTNGDITSILMTALCLLTGNIDNPGGLVFIDTQKAARGNRTAGKAFLQKTVVRKVNDKDVSGAIPELNKDLYGDYPATMKGVLADMPEKIREGVRLRHGPFKGYRYPVKAYISRAGNPLITAGSTPDWIDALTSRDKDGEYKLELMVFIDTHISMTGIYADIVLPDAGFLERMGVSDVYTMSPEISIRDRVIEPLYESKTPFEFMVHVSDALIKHGDPDIRAEDFSKKYNDEEDFINEILSEAPGFYNIGTPLPYPDLPEGCRITGTPDNPGAILGDKTIREGEPLTVDWLRRHHGVAVWPASYYRYKKSDGSPSGIYPKTPSGKFEFKFSRLERINREFGTAFPTTFYWHDNKWNPANPE
jgi:anaerobic selenocysteine-containing dehydrogenase/ferredoxin